MNPINLTLFYLHIHSPPPPPHHTQITISSSLITHLLPNTSKNPLLDPPLQILLKVNPNLIIYLYLSILLKQILILVSSELEHPTNFMCSMNHYSVFYPQNSRIPNFNSLLLHWFILLYSYFLNYSPL